MSRSAPEIAEYQESASAAPPLRFTIRAATPDDAPAIARLDAARNGTDAAEILPLVQRDLEAATRSGSTRRCWVAMTEGEIVGFARAGWKDYAAAPGAGDVPSGWYLTGIVVSPELRRRGIGRALTRHRLKVLIELGAEEVYSFTSTRNRVSLALHRAMGFEELRRDVAVPGVTFQGGVGVLFRLRLDGSGSGARARPGPSL